MVAVSTLVLCAQQLLATTIYVSPTGLDTNKGTSASPYLTIAKAISRASARATTTIPATIILMPGNYFLTEQVYLDSTDSNLTIQGEDATIYGSTVLSDWTPLGSDPYGSTFPAAARASILETNLNTQLSSTALTTIEAPSIALSMDVLEDGQPLALAQYPAPGTWLTTSSKTSGSTLAWTSTVPKTWTGVTQVWMSGYPIYDWGYTNAPLTDVNGSAMTATMGDSVTALPGSRFQFVNVPQSLSAPGQYYLNRATMTLYFWPTNPSFNQVAINTCTDPMFNLAGAAGVTFKNLSMQGSLTNTIWAHQSTSINVTNCVINGCSGLPLWYQGCTGSQIVNTTISNCGQSAISMDGGALGQSSGDLISNCTITNFGRLARNSPAVILYGGGTIITHNLIQNGPYDAIDLYGPSHQITNNIINNVDFEVSDSGAIYEGRQPLARGLTIQNNWFENVSLNFTPNPQTAAQVAQVYLDDMQPGATVEGNIFQNGNIGVIAGGGRDNTINYNVFLGNSLVGIQLDARGTSWAYPYCTYGGSWDYLDSIQYELANVPLWVQIFPIASDALTNQPYFPVRFSSSDNAYFGSFIAYQDSTGPNNTTCLNNVQLSSSNLQSALAAVPKGYTMPSLSQIGPQPYNNL